ncbi:MAG: hypothetical protein ACKPBV_20280, partial [Sphaerospermopsis kisseleviana]
MLVTVSRLKKSVVRTAVVAAFSPLVALMATPRAQALLRYDIFEQSGNTYVKASGSFTFGGGFSTNLNACSIRPNGNLHVTTTSASDATSFINICTGPQPARLRTFPLTAINFPVSGSTSSMPTSIPGISSTGTPTFVVAQPDANPEFSFFELALDEFYTSGDAISSTSIFAGNFATNSITPPPITLPALIGSFQLAGGGDRVE